VAEHENKCRTTIDSNDRHTNWIQSASQIGTQTDSKSTQQGYENGWHE
jgi:hypothetical protein